MLYNPKSCALVVAIRPLLSVIVPWLLLFCLGYAPLATAQPPTAVSQAVELYRQGEAQFLQKNYRSAARLFQRALAQQPSLLAASRLLGQVEALQGNYLEATEAYKNIITTDSSYSRTLYYELGEVYARVGRPELALHYYRQFRDKQRQPLATFGLQGEKERPQELIYLDRLSGSMRAAEVSIDSAKFINITEIHNLGDRINSAYDDYFPFLSNDQRTIFYTRKDNSGDEDLYVSTYTTAQQWRYSDRVANFNSRQPEGMAALVRHGRKVFFTACGRDSSGGACDIWEALVQGETISQVSALTGSTNSSYWDSQAAISCDGRQLFFASTRPGGMGGSDIWTSELQADGSWGPPVNLGATINTAKDEEAPFISNDSRTLYFSSTGHEGQGDQDIFMSWWDERLQRWSVSINLGLPVNSPHRELGFFLSADGSTGYFASDRPGGVGQMDIYRFDLAEQLTGDDITFVQGIVLDSVLRDPVPNQPVLLNKLSAVRTDADGYFFLCARADQPLTVRTTDNSAYRPYMRRFPIPVWENRSNYELEILLFPKHSFLAQLEKKSPGTPYAREQESSLVHSIFFESDASQMTPPELDRLTDLALQLKEKNIKRIEIIGYTDSQGVNTYNLRLSEERAKNIALHLLTYGIDINQINIEGKGSIHNDRPKELNRRVDVRVLAVD